MTKIAKAISIWLETIAQTMIGTRMMRPSVMIFGMLNSVASGFRSWIRRLAGSAGSYLHSICEKRLRAIAGSPNSS
jgi:hypothetical protein